MEKNETDGEGWRRMGLMEKEGMVEERGLCRSKGWWRRKGWREKGQWKEKGLMEKNGTVGGLELDDLKSPFQPELFYDSLLKG